MKYKRYERYKDSGVEWIGEIPEEWKTVLLKRIFTIINGGTPSSSEKSYWNGDIIWVTPNDLSKITEVYIEDSERKITEDGLHNCSAKIVPKGSIVISTRAPIGYVAIAGVPLCTNQGCKSLVLIRGGDAKYFYYCFLSSEKYLNVLGQGTTFIELSNGNLSMVELLNPPLNEQKAIADFLDKKTSEIDDLIADKEKLIELLQEKRQTIITEAVTKGLNPNVRMKDSGIEWIGEIPEHWEITKLGYRARMIVPMRDKPTEFNGDIPWIRIEDVDGKYIEDSKSEQRVSKELAKEMNLKVYPVGTVLCTCSCNMGTTVIVKKPLISNQTFIGIVPMKNLDSTFLYYVMNANSKRLQYLAEGAIQQYLSRHDFEHLKLAFPDIEEQKSIAKFLAQKTIEIDNLITDINTQIQKLKEYRQSLISEAVTGKIDVRDYDIN